MRAVGFAVEFAVGLAVGFIVGLTVTRGGGGGGTAGHCGQHVPSTRISCPSQSSAGQSMPLMVLEIASPFNNPTRPPSNPLLAPLADTMAQRFIA